MYRNEAHVGEAVREFGIPREEVFVSMLELPKLNLGMHAHLRSVIATKIASRDHGYESTLRGVDESLKRFGFGKASTSDYLSLLK